MKRIFCLLLMLVYYFVVFGQIGTNLRYEKNKGQWDDRILYQSSFHLGRAYVLQNKLNILVFDTNNQRFHPHRLSNRKDAREKYTIFSIAPSDAKFSTPIAEQKYEGYTNYFIGNDTKHHASNVPSFATITYKDVYSNIDWQISSFGSSPKHSYIVHKGGNISDIKTLYKGSVKVEIDSGKLVVKTPSGVVEEDSLLVYQIKDGSIVMVNANYALEKVHEGTLVHYNIAEYDKDLDLVIDPSLIFSTYSGSHSDNWGATACYDSKGLIISGGICSGDYYPLTEGTYDESFSGNWDCVITKYDSLGQNLVFSTFLGGSFAEMPHSMITNHNGELVMYGSTSSTNFPMTQNAFQPIMNGGEGFTYENSLRYTNGSDIFLTVISAEGDSLVASTFIGGSGNDGINYRSYYDAPQILYGGNDTLYYNYGDFARGEVTVDRNNNIYVASCTFSSDFPTSAGAAFTSSYGKQEAVVFKFDALLSTLLYSTYLGGNLDDAAYSIDLEESTGKAYICGGTASTNFYTTMNAYHPLKVGGSADAFISVISPDGHTVEASTYFGSNKYDQAYFIRLDKDGYPHIFGQTKALNSTLVHNSVYNVPNSGQFIAKLSKNLDTLLFSSVFGTGDGRINISPSCFAVDMCGRIYSAGWGRVFKYSAEALGYSKLGTTDLPITSDAYMSETDGMDFYIACFDSNMSGLNYATFFGENSPDINSGNDHVDGGTSRFDRFGSFYLTACASCGATDSFPVTSGAFSSSNNSTNCNMASAKFMVHDDFAVADFYGPNVYCDNATVVFVNHSRGTSFEWNFGDGTPLDTNREPIHIYSHGGTYTVTLVATLLNGCRETDTIRRNILILSNTLHSLDTISVCPNLPVNIGLDSLMYSREDEVTFSWTPQECLSNTSIPNPYAVVDTSTMFMLIISTPSCSDTFYRYVNVETFPSGLADTISFCASPDTCTIPNPLHRTIVISWSPSFEEILAKTANDAEIILEDTISKYLYVRYYMGDCMDVDSIWIKYEGHDLDIMISGAGCRGESKGSAMVDGNNGVYNHYEWSCSSKDTNLVDHLAAGTYNLRAYSDDGCEINKSFTIKETPSIDIKIFSNDLSCWNRCDGNAKVTPLSGQEPYTYKWSTNANTDSIYNLCEGSYFVSVTDGNNCTQNASVTIEAPSDNEEFFAYVDKDTVYDGQQIYLFSTEIDGFSYRWTPRDYLVNPYSSATFGTIYSTTTYFVTIDNGKNCTKSDSVSVYVVYVNCGKPNIFIPNAFTPNDDGRNDVVYVSGNFISKIHFMIYDRWGEKVFETRDMNEHWDGKYNGQNCPAGVYYYRIDIDCMGGKTYTGKGDITLIR